MHLPKILLPMLWAGYVAGKDFALVFDGGYSTHPTVWTVFLLWSAQSFVLW